MNANFSMSKLNKLDLKIDIWIIHIQSELCDLTIPHR